MPSIKTDSCSEATGEIKSLKTKQKGYTIKELIKSNS